MGIAIDVCLSSPCTVKQNTLSINCHSWPRARTVLLMAVPWLAGFSEKTAAGYLGRFPVFGRICDRIKNGERDFRRRRSLDACTFVLAESPRRASAGTG